MADTAKEILNKTEGNTAPEEKISKAAAGKDISTSKTTRKIHELRTTPGYTTYVTDVKKTLAGAISSAQLKRYYSNIDAEIYFNGEWVEDIGTIQWTVNQQTMPIYGYNSYIYDAVAQGSRLIQGTFTLSFTKPRKIDDIIKQAMSSRQTTLSYEEIIAKLDKNITVNLGRNGTDLRGNPEHKALWMNNRFDIDIVCGEYESIGDNALHIILQDCYLTDIATARGKDGGVAEEQYSFIARDYKTIG